MTIALVKRHPLLSATLGKVTRYSFYFVFDIPSIQTKDVYHQHHMYITDITVTISYIVNTTYLTNITNLTCFFTNITRVHKTQK
jgi:hypothetical protein